MTCKFSAVYFKSGDSNGRRKLEGFQWEKHGQLLLSCQGWVVFDTNLCKLCNFQTVVKFFHTRNGTQIFFVHGQTIFVSQKIRNGKIQRKFTEVNEVTYCKRPSFKSARSADCKTKVFDRVTSEARTREKENVLLVSLPSLTPDL